MRRSETRGKMGVVRQLAVGGFKFRFEWAAGEGRVQVKVKE